MSILVENIEFDQFRYLGMQIRPYFFVSHPVVQIQHVQFTIALKELSITMHLVPCAPQYIRTVSSLRLLSTLLIQFELVYWQLGRATNIVHLISAQDQPRRKRMYH